MPATIRESSIRLRFPEVEALFPRPEEDGPLPHVFPYPELRLTGRNAERELDIVVLENDALEVWLAPDLGGRLLRVHLKAEAIDLLSVPDELGVTLSKEGWLCADAGIDWRVGGNPGPLSLGPVDFALLPPGDQSEPARVAMFQWLYGHDLSWNLEVALDPSRPRIYFQGSVLNRSLRFQRFFRGIALSGFGREWRASRRPGVAAANLREGWAVRIAWGPSDFASVRSDEGSCHLSRNVELAPRQVETWKLSLEFAQIGVPIEFLSPELAATGTGESLVLWPGEVSGEGSIHVLDSSGREFESPMPLQSGVPVEVDVSTFESGVQALAWKSADGSVYEGIRDSTRAVDLNAEEANWWDDSPQPSRFDSWDGGELSQDDGEASRLQLIEATRWPELRGGAWVALAARAMRMGEWDEAWSHAESAIAHNATDPLAWWMGSVALSESEQPEMASEALSTAHTLSPLEPLLRVEAFLHQPHAAGKGPNPLARPAAQNPQTAVGVAALLVGTGRLAEASQWIEEALRVGEIPLLRYLLAWLLLLKTRHATEAAHQVRKAAQEPWGPPFPWRNVEVRAIRELASAFPNDERLSEWTALLNRSRV